MKRLFLVAISGLLAISNALIPTIAAAASTPPPAAASGGAAGDGPLVLDTSPLPIDLVADPGKSVSTDIRVKQDGDQTAQLKVNLMKFGAYGDSGKPQLLDRAPGDDYFDWVHFDRTTFTAPPNVWETLHMTINLPKTAAFGYYYAVVFSRAGDDAKHPGTTNSVAGATAVLVLLEARNPNAKRTLQLVSFSAEHRLVEFLPAKFDVLLANSGNVHGVPEGDIFISKGNKQLAALSFNSGGGNVLPQSKRLFNVQWTDGFPNYQAKTQDGKVVIDKHGNQVNQLVWNNGPGVGGVAPHLRFGKYKAELVALYDDGGHEQPIDATVTFWVIPWRLILAVLLLVGLVGFGVYMAVRGTVRSAARGARSLRRRRS